MGIASPNFEVLRTAGGATKDIAQGAVFA